MKVLYFDCFSGISGDMTLGALLDLGIDVEVFKRELSKLNLKGYDIAVEKKASGGITGTDVQVVINEEYERIQQKLKQHEHEHEHEHEHGHEHEHEHEHVHDHGGDAHGHSHPHPHSHTHSMRNLKSIEMIIDWSDLNDNVKVLSKKVFREIGRAEAKVHGKPVEEIEFHEVGAIDSIVDIVGTAICLDLLGIKKVFSSPLHDGKGFIECNHGLLPVPVPAVMEMLSGSNIPFITEDVDTELVTPTGMGLIKCLASDFGNMPAMLVDRIGYGLGKREIGRTNALRVVMGTLLGEDDIKKEEIAVLETNIDDMSPEMLSFAMDSLFEGGALDVFYTPVYMKKNRPAVKLTVLVDKDAEKEAVDIILKQTTTLGVRRTYVQRYCMDREIHSVDTELGEIRVKVATCGDFKKLSPEYEDCKTIAAKWGMPLDRIYDLARRNAQHLL
ncbi:MAG: nickel pincer cofactor biosynthesis protein LarC [Clostridiales bacterium]|jgi:uncharacterized protein (TIGR00299 family) protein|nr:nickel pincer cofactor biosynthesis protein LarC [Eubacteriales bacterium]MDH7565570.1 nickel pincer cofactor biosynthesis protein LarC [Clostridiales bacterium]